MFTRSSLIITIVVSIISALLISDVYSTFHPDLTLAVDDSNDRFLHSSFSAHRWQTESSSSSSIADVQTNHEYGIRMCIGASGTSMTGVEMSRDCFYDTIIDGNIGSPFTLSSSLSYVLNATLPSHFVRPFIRRQERYDDVHSQILKLTSSDDHDASSSSTLAPRRLRSLCDQLLRLRASMLSSSSFLHVFIYRLDADNARVDGPMADRYHVHLASQIIARRVIQQPAANASTTAISTISKDRKVKTMIRKEDERNKTKKKDIISASGHIIRTDVIDTVVPQSDTPDNANESSSSSPTTASLSNLVYHLRPSFHFHVVTDSSLSFPVSRVPIDLQHLLLDSRYTNGKDQTYYAPLVAIADFATGNNEWIALNGTYLQDIEKQESMMKTSISNIDDDASSISDHASPSSGFPLHISITSRSLGSFRLFSQFDATMRVMSEVERTVESVQRQATIAVRSANGGTSVEHEDEDARRTKGQKPSIVSSHKSVSPFLIADLLAHEGLDDTTAMLPSFLDELASIAQSTHPILLALTVIVAILHLLFDTLAFRDDINYWREKGKKEEDFKGVSKRSIWVSTIVRLIILLYLIDRDASRIVIGSNILSLVIGIWKSAKILRVTIGLTSKFPFVLKFADQPEQEVKSEDVDRRVMRLLFVYIGSPLLVCCIGYSLMYDDSHKFDTYRGIYSFALHICATCLYVGGFLLMMPQLILNYRRKSVPNLPVKVVVYRAINTFIDDLFAFIVPMPPLHRLACLRDDVIFIIYMYQRYIYPVDQPIVASKIESMTSPADASSIVDAVATKTTPTDAIIQADNNASNVDAAKVLEASAENDQANEIDQTLTKRHVVNDTIITKENAS